MGGGGSSSGSSSNYTNPISNSGAGKESGAKNDCNTLSFETRLQQPQEAALSKVEEGDVLPLRVPPRIIRVEVINRFGELCGSIVSPHLHTLINCIEKGHAFEAAILQLKDSSCTVLVQRVKT